MPLGLFSNVLIPTLIREKSPAVWKKNALTLMEKSEVLRLFQSILAYTRRWWVVVGKKERKHQRKQSVRQIPPTNAQKVRHSHAPLLTIIWSCSPHVHPVQRGGREVFSRLLMNNNQASLFWTRSRSPDFILQRPVRYLHALTYLSMLSPLPASPLVCLWFRCLPAATLAEGKTFYELTNLG